MTQSRRDQGLEPYTKDVARLPFDKEGGKALVVQEIIVGRPRKLDNLQDVRHQMNAYLTYCTENSKVPSLAGMALTLGVSKSAFEQKFPEYGDEHKELYELFRTVVEAMVVDKMFSEPKLSIASIFYLKNLGWRDDRGMQMGDDNRTVNNIIIQTDKGVSKIELETGKKESKKIKRGRGRPKKYDGEVELVPVVKE